MKFINYTNDGRVVVQHAALILSKLDETDTLELHTMDNAIILLKKDMTLVETVVLLSHKKPDGHINVKVEFGEGEGKVPLDNIAKRAEEYKPKERVTYKMIKEY